MSFMDNQATTEQRDEEATAERVKSEATSPPEQLEPNYDRKRLRVKTQTKEFSSPAPLALEGHTLVILLTAKATYGMCFIIFISFFYI